MILIVSTRAEPLNAITNAELVLEGLCERCRVPPHEPVNRIELEYLD